MATDFNKFKELLEKRSETGNTKKSAYLKMEKGTSKTVRFLPLKSQGLELPIEIYDHHAIKFPDGKYEYFACPKKKDGSHCPFCDMAWDAWKKFSATQNEDYKSAFKNLIVKSAYLLVGYDVDAIDPSNITEDDTFIVRTASKDAIASIDNMLVKGRDFVDFNTGKNATLTKPKSDMQAITFVWDDPEPAFQGKGGEKIWNKLVEVSRDLTEVVTPPSPDKLNELVSRFKATPTEQDLPSSKNEEEEEKPVMTTNRTPAKKAAPVEETEGDGVDLDALRKMIEED